MPSFADLIEVINLESNLELSSEDYSGYWCHRFTNTGQIAVDTASNQAHIAVTDTTGAMLLFPVVTSSAYEQNPTGALSGEKTRYVLQLQVTVFKDNLLKLLTRAHHFTNTVPGTFLDEAEIRVAGSGTSIETHAECRFNIRANEQRQIEIGRITRDGLDFNILRRCLKADDYIVFLQKGAAKFDVVGLPAEVMVGHDWRAVRPPPVGTSMPVFGDDLAAAEGTLADHDEDEIWDLLLRRMNVVLYGPPGTGKTYRAFEVCQRWESVNGTNSVRNITFHPTYSYEDFVQGYRPLERDPQAFALQEGALLQATRLAWHFWMQDQAQTERRKVLIMIDEINRADVARVFGELITYVEPDKRGKSFVLSQTPRQKHAIPPNLYFLGTMNTADKSVSLLDVALRRRFAFVEFRPDPSSFQTIKQWAGEVGGVQLGDLLRGINRRLEAVGVGTDRALGQALLSVNSLSLDPIRELRERLNYDVFPLVEEYLYFDRKQMQDVLPGLIDSVGRWSPPTTTAQFLDALRDLAEAENGSLLAPEDFGVEDHQDLPLDDVSIDVASESEFDQDDED
jgi:AAA domain (dynein-related subfamily)